MPRSVNHVASRARRKKILKETRGNFLARKNVWTVAKNTYEKGLTYAYRDRKNKKRNFRALWEIRKKDLQQYASLNTEAYSKINDIFRKYHLADEYELTPERAESFIRNIRESNPKKRIQWLQDNAGSYKYFNDYYYYLGMSYYEVKY